MLVVLTMAGCLVNTELYEGRKAALTDADGDGFVHEDDCDDDDATVAALLWYPDADVDGFGASTGTPVSACVAPDGYVANALDCDDAATKVNPGADEVPYDGVDDDCDGDDLDDVDGDGHAALVAGGDDCDDEDDTVHPGATDVPYDGIDQDCAAGDADDLDGDGEAALEAGGTDCDDADPDIRSGADETWADGFTDNDCDGTLEAATLHYGDDAWFGTQPAGEVGRRLGAVGDVTGDGLADYLVSSTCGEGGAYTCGGGVYLVSGTAGGPLDGVPEMVAGGDYWFLAPASGGVPDVDDDGVPDILVSATGYADRAGAAWLVSGAAFAGSTAPFDPTDHALATALGSTPDGFAGATVVPLGDIMGDGSIRYAVSAPLAAARGFANAGTVGLFDAADRGVTSMEDAPGRVDGYFEGANMGNRLSTAGDIDGDGLEDYMVSFGAGDLAVILPGGVDEPTLPEDAIFRLTTHEGDPTAECMVVGDLDGDGRRDMGCIEAYSTLRLYLSLNTTPVRLGNAPSATVSYEAGAYGDILLDLGDLDGDGRDETLIPLAWSPSLTTAVAVVQPGSVFSVGATLNLLDAPLQAVATRNGNYGDRVILAGDVDGDGVEDIVLGGYGDDAGGTNAGGVVTIPVPH